MESGFEDTPVRNSGERLAVFLSDVQELLGDITVERSSLFRTELQRPLGTAWDELQPSFKMADRYLRDPPDPDLLDAQLAHVGLTRSGFALKWEGFSGALGALSDRFTKRGLRSILGWANIILGSLAGIVPGGDAIKEYKEVVEQAVEDDDGNDDAESAQQPPFHPYVRSRISPLGG